VSRQSYQLSHANVQLSRFATENSFIQRMCRFVLRKFQLKLEPHSIGFSCVTLLLPNDFNDVKCGLAGLSVLLQQFNI
jgi:hypothetical protein